MRLVRKGTPLTHLFSVDDLLLFAEATCDQARIISSILDVFCGSSEAKVSMEKTQIFFSKKVKADEAKQIGNMLGFSVTKDLGTYLGMPLPHSKVSKSTYQNIIDKVKSQLSG